MIPVGTFGFLTAMLGGATGGFIGAAIGSVIDGYPRAALIFAFIALATAVLLGIVWHLGPR